ncbi:hypothetical protein FQN55_002340 [Onygenales sp. PD_40]|nr:hypothetical protein FQN55_002340 [Onygenales sp. PD_40]
MTNSPPHPPSPTPFPKPTIIPPRGPHTHTLILLHGRGDSSLDFSTDLITLSLPIPSNPSLNTLPQRFPGLKFIFPSAKLGRSTASGNVVMPQWFDLETLDPPHAMEHELQKDGLRASVNYLLELVRGEAEVVGAGNVVVGGLSQGGVVALGATVGFEGVDGAALGGCVAMSCWLPFQRELMALARDADSKNAENGNGNGGEDEGESESESEPWHQRREDIPTPPPALSLKAANYFRENILDIPPIPGSVLPDFPKCPLWIAHGTLDEHVKPRFGEDAARTMERLGWDVTWMLYDELQHWYMPDELEDMATFLNVVVGVPEAE